MRTCLPAYFARCETVRPGRSRAAIVVAALLAVATGLAPAAWAQPQAKGASGLPLPRFVSLKSDKVNVRIGPGQDYDVAWIFVRAGWPVEITQEFENWRKIRDSDGAEGWIFHSLLSGRRTALVTPWAETGESAVREEADPKADILAFLEPRVFAEVSRCEKDWCQVRGNGYAGWIEQARLWGVYPGETFDGN